MSQFSIEKFKLPPQAIHLLVPLFLSFSMSCIVSLISTFRNVGFPGFDVCIWFFSWMISWGFAFPSVLILLPIVKKMALKLIRA